MNIKLNALMQRIIIQLTQN